MTEDAAQDAISPSLSSQLQGCRIRLISCADPDTRLEPGTWGLVTFVDGLGTVHVSWDDGSRLGLIPGLDQWEIDDRRGSSAMSASTVDRCPRCGNTKLSYGAGHMACCGSCGLIADEEVFEVPIEEVITDEMVADFADTAREGDSTYWCDELACLRPPDRPLTYFGEKLAAGAWYAAAEFDEDSRQRDWHPIDAARMRVGIGKAAEHFDRPIDTFYEQHDAGEADVAFQFAILGNIVYG